MKYESHHVGVQLLKGHQERSFRPGRFDVVLDIGVGSGSSTIDLSKDSLFVIGIDKDEEMLETAHQKVRKEHIKNVLLIKTEVEKIDSVFTTESFDFINCYAAFHHFYDTKAKKGRRFSKPREILRKISKILKNDGVFTLFDPVFTAHTRDKWEEIIREREKIHPEGDGQFYTMKEFQKLMDESGFSITESRNYMFERHLNEWIKGAIKIKSTSETPQEKKLKNKVIKLFEDDTKVAKELQANFNKDNWIFHYPIIDIKAVKK